ncbi:MAG: MmgE/PrpD family protein [Rhodospirillales bacterium]
MAVVEQLSDYKDTQISITQKIAEFAIETRAEDIPENLYDCAKRSQLDTIGVALGGVADDDAAKILAAHAQEVAGADDVPNGATVIGQGFKTALPYAAHINGTAADVIGFSDVALETYNHPSPSICPPLWALGEKMGFNGKDILTAHIIGLEIAEKIGRAFLPKFHQKGWEPRGVTNTFAAAAACARLLGLDVKTTANALGICGAEASGMRAVKGTMSKAYINGMSARNGLEAALLASKGYTGPENVFEAKDGVMQTFGEGADGHKIWQALANPWEYLDPGITYKRFPVCTCTHTAIEATIKLRDEHNVKPGDIESVLCSTTPGAYSWLPFNDPQHKFQGKYSMPFTVALAILEGNVVLKDVTNAKVRDKNVRALMKKITMDVLEEYEKAGHTPAHAPYGCRVEMKLKDGRTVAHQQDNPSWATEPPDWDGLAHKFTANASMILPNDKTEQAVELCHVIEKLDNISRLMDTVRG